MADAKQPPFHFGSYVLSRVAFIGTHLDVAYWVNFLLNDPFHLGTNTLDYQPTNGVFQPNCKPWIIENVWFNVCMFVGVWWAQHSIMARKMFKQSVGLWQHPIERPLYAVCAVIAWFITLHTWRPVSTCAHDTWNPATTNIVIAIACVLVWVLALLLVLGFLYTLPTHVFGTGHYRYTAGAFPANNEPMTMFPYGLVRHPAAAGFLWMYWALPSYTANHLLLTLMWTVFIVAGTQFEERGLRGPDEFGSKYAAYSARTWAFIPTPSTIQSTFFGKKRRE